MLYILTTNTSFYLLITYYMTCMDALCYKLKIVQWYKLVNLYASPHFINLLTHTNTKLLIYVRQVDKCCASFFTANRRRLSSPVPEIKFSSSTLRLHPLHRDKLYLDALALTVDYLYRKPIVK